MKRKRSGSDPPVASSDERPVDDDDEEHEDRLEQLLEAAGAAATMPEASDGEPGDLHSPLEIPVDDPAAKRPAMAIDDVETAEDEFQLPNMRRCGLCGGTTDGDPAAENPPVGDVPVGEANGSFKPQDETCLADVTLDTKKSDGFGAEKGWLGRLLGPLGEHFGVGGVWVHENCAIWSPEVYFSGIGRLKNVKAALRRGRLLRCSLCNQPGATIGCRVDRCPQNYHLPCARAEGSMFNHRKYLMACYDHSHLFKRRRKNRYWISKSLTAHQRRNFSEHSSLPRISKAQRRTAAAAARLKDIEAEEKYLDKSGEDEEFVRRERKRLQRDLAQIAPVKLGGGSLASNQGVAPEGWDSVAGLQDVVQCLKEMVTLPLLYPEAFTRLGISAPRGVLLHGHPGTGKTLVVRALAGACSRGDQQVSYFARKGADILGKYVGDSERQLRLLFQVAEQCQPAIIFFDEIDGLAPSRCGDRDQTQSSVVSTLLALMDGLSSRGSVVVIGATNRPDSLDPALRRPGRFDREIYFPLPSTVDRVSILRLHTRKWSPAPSPEILAAVSKATPGFAGADLQALCVETAMTALRRVVPLKYILDSAAQKGLVETGLPSLPAIQVKAKDWAKAVARAPLPCSRRLASTALIQAPAAPLPRHLAPALLPLIVEVLVKLGLDARVSLPPLLEKCFSKVKAALIAASNLSNTDSYFSNGVLPESWFTMVVNSFKGNPSSLCKAVEDAFLDTGIMMDTYGAPSLSQPASTMHLGNAGPGSDKSRVASKTFEEPSDNGGQLPTCMRQIFSDDSLDGSEFATKQNWPGCKFRILLLGGAQQGQKFVAGAIINGFEGRAQIRTLSLPAMLMEGAGDVEQGLIFIVEEARRSGPCLLYMPKIEDWVVGKVHDDEQEKGDNVKHPEGFGISNAEADDHPCGGRSETIVNREDGAVLHVSDVWKLMKQQVQSMPPGNQLMILATCESGRNALPTEVINYFAPPVETSLRKSSPYPSQAYPCMTVDFTGCHDVQGVLVRASEDIARALAAGFASRIARLREAYMTGCSAEKPKVSTAAEVRLSTSVHQIIADKVSQIQIRVREDLGRDLRNIGQDWARNFGGAPYGNDLAKVFGVDVGRGLGLDLGPECSGLVKEVNKECGVNVEGRVRGDAEMGDAGASCVTRGRNIEHSFIDTSEYESQNSTRCKDASFVLSGNRSWDDIDGNANDCVKKVLLLRGKEFCLSNFDISLQRIQGVHGSLDLARFLATCLGRCNVVPLVFDVFVSFCCTHADVCAAENLVKDTQSHRSSMDVEQLEGQTSSVVLANAKDEGIQQSVAEELSPSWTAQRKALQSAIAFCGYRLLHDPQLAGLRNATSMLKLVPVFDVHDCIESGTFNWKTLETRCKDEVHEPEYVRGLAAVAYKACRGIYRTGREVEFEFRRVIETLYQRVEQKIENGKDSLQYFHLTTQAATLVDLMASWVLEVRKLEVAANMHNLPIAKSIVDDDYTVEDQKDQEDSDKKQSDDVISVEAGNGERQSTEVELVEPSEDGSEQVSRQDLKNSLASNGNDSEALRLNDLAEASFKKDVVTEEMPVTPNFHEIQPSANGVERAASQLENSLVDVSLASEKTKCKHPVASERNEGKFQKKSPSAETTPERGLLSENGGRLSSFRGSITPEASLRRDDPVEGEVSRMKSSRQSVRFKPDCFRQLESVVREYLDLSCKAETSDFSLEVLHDRITGCASSALAASQSVLSKSEKTNITRQVILQWAGLTCHCGGGRPVEVDIAAPGMDGSPRQLSSNGSLKQATPTGQTSSRRSKKRKTSRLSISDFPAPPAKRPSISVPETPLPVGLISPVKHSNSTKSYTCLRPVIRAVKCMVDCLPSSRDFNAGAHK